MSEDHCELLCLDVAKAEDLRDASPGEETLGQLADLAKSLADPTRLKLALALRAGDELCVCDLSWIAERAEGVTSHHLRLMRRGGICRSRRSGKMILYSLTENGRHLLSALTPDLDRL